MDASGLAKERSRALLLCPPDGSGRRQLPRSNDDVAELSSLLSGAASQPASIPRDDDVTLWLHLACDILASSIGALAMCEHSSRRRVALTLTAYSALGVLGATLESAVFDDRVPAAVLSAFIEFPLPVHGGSSDANVSDAETAMCLLQATALTVLRDAFTLWTRGPDKGSGLCSLAEAIAESPGLFDRAACATVGACAASYSSDVASLVRAASAAVAVETLSALCCAVDGGSIVPPTQFTPEIVSTSLCSSLERLLLALADAHGQSPKDPAGAAFPQDALSMLLEREVSRLAPLPLAPPLFVVLGTVNPVDVDAHAWSDSRDGSPDGAVCSPPADFVHPPSPHIGVTVPSCSSPLGCIARAIAAAAAAHVTRPRSSPSSLSPMSVVFLMRAARSCAPSSAEGDARLRCLRARFAVCLLDALFDAGGLRFLVCFTLLAQPEDTRLKGRRFTSIWNEAMCSCVAIEDFVGPSTVEADGAVRILCNSRGAFESLCSLSRLVELCERVARDSFSQDATASQQSSEYLGHSIVCALASCVLVMGASSAVTWLCCGALGRLSEANSAVSTALCNVRAMPTLLYAVGILVERLGGIAQSLPSTSSQRRVASGMSPPQWFLPAPPWCAGATSPAVASTQLDDDYFADHLLHAPSIVSSDTVSSPALCGTSGGSAAQWSHTSERGAAGCRDSGGERAITRAALRATIRLLYLHIGRPAPEVDLHRAIFLCLLNTPLRRNAVPRSASVVSTAATAKSMAPKSADAAFQACGIRFVLPSPLAPLIGALALKPVREEVAGMLVELSLAEERVLEAGSSVLAIFAESLTLPTSDASSRSTRATPHTEPHGGFGAWASAAMGLFSGVPSGGDFQPHAIDRWLSGFAEQRSVTKVLRRAKLDLPWSLNVRDDRTVVIDAEAVTGDRPSAASAPSRSALLSSMHFLIRRGSTLVAAAFRQSLAALALELRSEADPGRVATLLKTAEISAAVATRILTSTSLLAHSSSSGQPTATTLLASLAERDARRAKLQRWLIGHDDAEARVSVVRAILSTIECSAESGMLDGCWYDAARALAAGLDLLSVLTSRNTQATASFSRASGLRRIIASVGGIFRAGSGVLCGHNAGSAVVVESLLRYVVAADINGELGSQQQSSHPVRSLSCPHVVRPEAAIALLVTLESASEAAAESGLRGILALVDPSQNLPGDQASRLPVTAPMLHAATLRNAHLIAEASESVLDVVLLLGKKVHVRLFPLLLRLISAFIPHACSSGFFKNLLADVNNDAQVSKLKWAAIERVISAACRARSSAPWPLVPSLTVRHAITASPVRASTRQDSPAPDYTGPPPRSFFSFDSEMSGLRLVTQRSDGLLVAGLSHWPGCGRPGGSNASSLSFSFHCWVCIRGDGHVIINSSDGPRADALFDHAARAANAHAARAASSNVSLPPCVAPPLACVGESPTLLYVSDEGGRSLCLGLKATGGGGILLGPSDVACGVRPEGYIIQFSVRHQRKSPETLEATSMPLILNRWYAVSVTHEKPAASLIARSFASLGVGLGGHDGTAKIFVNGACVAEVSKA